MPDTFTEITDAHERIYDESTLNRDSLYADDTFASEHGLRAFSQRGDSSDEVDPRKLVRDPSLSELRWYYRRTFAKKLVNKPIEDAFKNDFEFTGPNADEARRIVDMPRFGNRMDYIDAHMMAEKKSRRDGFALLFIGTRDTTDGTHISPIESGEDVESISHVKVLSIDDLSDSGVIHDQIAEGTGIEDESKYEVRRTGIVVNTDITDPDFGTPIGYVLDSNPPQFIHADRVVHYTWNPEVDGDYGNNSIERWDARGSVYGMYEGDSILLQSYDLMKGLAKGNWAIMQALFRHASHMYTVTLPEDAGQEDMAAADKATSNINAKSSLVFPHGYETQQHESGNEIDPSNFYEVVFDQVCASHEMTKSVLFGTQSGTVSGSETDIKNYFNKVERYRSNRGESKIQEYVETSKRMLDNRTAREFEFPIDIEWGPLFKVDQETRMAMLQTQAQALGSLIGNYVVTPDEARELLSAEWSDIEYDDLTDDQMDILDRLNLAQVGQGKWAEANDPSPDTPREGGKEGGRPEGARQESGNSGTTPE